jgi:tRNA threonylcarbamoyladenosine biosynthesis protein TsaB
MEKDILILSADTSSEKFSLAILRGDTVIGNFRSYDINRQSSDMLPEIDRLLDSNSLSIKDIGLFCIGLGPGSFTGLRIGITTMRTMAIALNKPIAGVSSIDAIAHNALCCKETICVIIDAKQKKVYARFYKYRKGIICPIGRILLLGIDELIDKIKSPVLFSGDGIRIYKDSILRRGFNENDLAAESMWYPEAHAIGKLGMHKMKIRGEDNVFRVNPIYVYRKECQVVKKKRVSSIKS